MDPIFWQRQTPEQPLFPDMLWSRPENRRYGGKLLIAGGNSGGFAAVAAAYSAALDAGAGNVSVLLPDALAKSLGGVPIGSFSPAPSTPSGGLARAALQPLIEMSQAADGVLLAGDFGHNAETAILLESYVQKHDGQLVLAQDSLDAFYNSPQVLLGRPDTTLVLKLNQLQKLASGDKFEHAFTTRSNLWQLVENLHRFNLRRPAVNLIVEHADQMLVASAGRVSSTKPPLGRGNETTPITAARAAVWWAQNPTKTFEALTSSLVA